MRKWKNENGRLFSIFFIFHNKISQIPTLPVPRSTGTVPGTVVQVPGTPYLVYWSSTVGGGQ